ncbi:MAG: hypothetical protein R2806_25625 [Saprospiraceae bacterium]|nr:hypothetical protein [Lewinella sp.]
MFEHLELLLIGDPIEIEEFSYYLNDRFSDLIWHELNAPVTEKLKKVFDYQYFTSERNNSWDAYRLAEKLGVSSCPYCNKQYTHTTFNSSDTKRKKRIIRPDFDHFLDKANHPFLALSFYNLVPSCQICNSRMKGSARFSVKTHLHPYLAGFGDLVRFRLKVLDVSFFHGNLLAGKIELQESSFKTKAEADLIAKARNNIMDFKLEHVYQEHRDVVFELIHKSFLYPRSYLESLSKISDPPIFRTNEDLLRFITGNFVGEQELLHRPLSKLTRDVVFQFGL